MNKSIFKTAVAVAVTAAAVFCGGCGGNSDDDGGDGGGGGDGIVGAWSIVEMIGDDGRVEKISTNDFKLLFTFKSNGDFVRAELYKIIDFWISAGYEDKYIIKEDSICVVDCAKYSISGNTLTIGGSGSSTMKAVRENIASLGTVYSQDLALNETEWRRTSESGRIEFWDLCNYSDSDEIYISGSYDDVAWYTEGSRLTLLGLTCNEWFDKWDCASYSVSKTVKLDYQLSNGNKTLKLRRDGSAVWDEWVLDDGYSYSQSKSKADPEKAKRAVGPFELFRR